MVEGAVLTGGQGGTGMKHVKLHAFFSHFLKGYCRQIPAAHKKQSCGLVCECHSSANFSCETNTGNGLDNTVTVVVSQRKANRRSTLIRILCSWCVSAFCLKGRIVSIVFPALLSPYCHLLPLNKYRVPLHVHVDTGGCSTTEQPHRSVTDVPAGAIWLLAELMPFWPWCAVPAKSLFSLSRKSWKWTIIILRPYIAFSCPFFWFSLPMHLMTFHKPNKFVPVISHRLCVSVNWQCPITSGFQRPKCPLW